MPFAILRKVGFVKSLSYVKLFETPWTEAHQASLSFTVSQSLFKFMTLSQWCYLTISSSAAFFSSCLQSSPAVVATGLEKVRFHSNPKKGNANECSNYHTLALIPHASKVMLKILQARLQQYVNHELPDVQAGFRNGRGTRDQIAHVHWIIKKAREFQKNIYFCFIDYAKAFDSMDHQKLWKILKELGIPEHLTCLLRNLYTGQEAMVRIGYGTQTGSK